MQKKIIPNTATVAAIVVLVLVFVATAPNNAFAQRLINPLETGDIRIIIGRIIKVLLGLSGTAALAMFIYGGFTWMTSAGIPERITKGKKTLTWAVIGLAIMFTAYTLVDLVIKALTQAT